MSVRKSESTKPLWWYRHRCKNNIKLGLKENGALSIGLNSTGLKHCPMAGSCEHSSKPLGLRRGGNSLTSWATTAFSVRTVCRMENGDSVKCDICSAITLKL